MIYNSRAAFESLEQLPLSYLVSRRATNCLVAYSVYFKNFENFEWVSDNIKQVVGMFFVNICNSSCKVAGRMARIAQPSGSTREVFKASLLQKSFFI